MDLLKFGTTRGDGKNLFDMGTKQEMGVRVIRVRVD